MNWSLPAADTYFAPILQKDPRGFELDHLELALSHCRRFRTAVDGGAHIGTWTVAMAVLFERVIAFEPAADTFECLKANSCALENVVRMPQALAERVGVVCVRDDASRPGNTGARYIAAADRSADPVQQVPLDTFLINDLDFLKLDVEGSELPALKGAAETLKRCKPVVMIEVKRLRDHDPLAAVRWLIEFGYREVGRVRNDRVLVPGAA